MSAYSTLGTVLNSSHELCTAFHNHLRRSSCYQVSLLDMEKWGLEKKQKQIYKGHEANPCGEEAKLVIYMKDKTYCLFQFLKWGLCDELNNIYSWEYKFYLLRNVVLKMIMWRVLVFQKRNSHIFYIFFLKCRTHIIWPFLMCFETVRNSLA